MQWPQTPLTCRRCVMKTSNPFNLVGGVWKRRFTQFYRSFCHVSTLKRAFNLVFGRLAWPKNPLNLPISHVQTCFTPFNLVKGVASRPLTPLNLSEGVVSRPLTPFNLSEGVASRPLTPFNLSEGVASRPSTPFNLSEVLHQDHRPRSTCQRCCKYLFKNKDQLILNS